MKKNDSIHEHLLAVYGTQTADVLYDRLRALIDTYRKRASPVSLERRRTISEKDAILITYADQVTEKDIPPLRSLRDFCQSHIKEIISSVHVLPFYPYSSDDGFSVIDYKSVDPALGGWEEITVLGQHFRLMFDAVINHVSVQSEWFQEFLEGHPKYKDYFITITGNPDLSQVVRPRTLPLLTQFHTSSGERAVWTTFSADQVDLNYHNPHVLLDILDTLLFYAAQGAEFIRLDAIAYLWKEIGTPCIHLPQTHHIIQLFRSVLDEVFPHVMLITETNVPHADNISYFGDGTNEAQMVYNFALPPLVLHTLRTGNARALSDWARTLRLPGSQVTFFNFLASHDGIGLNPVRAILTAQEINALVEGTLARQGLVSYKQNSDGTQSPYELNINYFDALCRVDENGVVTETIELQVDRFMAAQAIMLSTAGVPGIYFHSLFGSRGWAEGVALTGSNRSINRQKFPRAFLEEQLAVSGSQPQRVFRRYAHMLKARTSCAAFHPNGNQHVLDCGETIFALLRVSPDEKKCVLILQNVSDTPQCVYLDESKLSHEAHTRATDLLTNLPIQWEANRTLLMGAYQIVWISW